MLAPHIDRAFLFHPTCREGKLFEGRDRLLAALSSGWVDSPHKLPPLEQLKNEPETPSEPEKSVAEAPKDASAVENAPGRARGRRNRR